MTSRYVEVDAEIKVKVDAEIKVNVDVDVDVKVRRVEVEVDVKVKVEVESPGSRNSADPRTGKIPRTLPSDASYWGMRLGVVVVVLAACSSGPGDAEREAAAVEQRHLPTPAERDAAPRSSAERMFGDPATPTAPAGTGTSAGTGANSAGTGANSAGTGASSANSAGTGANSVGANATATQPPYARLTPKWSHLRTVDGCFYFSGPEGRDDQLTGPVRVERTGDAVTLHIGGATFTGTYRNGELFVERHSEHDYFGRWTVSETIHGRYIEREMNAKYHYAECASNEPCPGRCTIDASLVFVR